MARRLQRVPPSRSICYSAANLYVGFSRPSACFGSLRPYCLPSSLLAAPICPATPRGLKRHRHSPTVTRVIDGDTGVVEGVGTVRLIGVDTPETVDQRRPVQYFGREASDFTKQLATGKRVRLEFDQDRPGRYGRTLAYVYLQPENCADGRDNRVALS